MSMTHYMELLVANQPWNLIIYMAIPVILGETLAITELIILYRKKAPPTIKLLNKYSGLVAGLYFLGIFIYLFQTAVIPLTLTSGWRGPADVIAVGFYLLGVIPLFGISLLELRILKGDTLKLHVIFVGLFLIVAHIAMIFGMLNPELLGWIAPSPAMSM